MKRFIVVTLLLTPWICGSVLLADEARDKAIQQIEDSGGRARPLANNDDRLVVDFYFVGDEFQDRMLAPLENLTDVYEVRLGETRLSDEGLKRLEGLVSLERLHLEKTQISDVGLAHLSALDNLRYLNLYGTSVTDAGLEHLANLRNLRRLYVWQTEVTDAGVDKLEAALPELVVDRGWSSSDESAPE